VWRFFACGIVALALFAPALHAESGIDLLVLVDRSASTSGSSPLFGDIQRIAAELLAQSAASSHLNHRLAIVSFGSVARVDLPFAAAYDERERIRRTIVSIPTSTLGRTNVVAAFDTARELFASLPRDALRKQAILLVTDGMPYGAAGTRCDTCNLQRIFEKSFAATTIDVLLLDGSRRAGVPPGLWQAVAGQRIYELHRDRATAVGAVHSVVAALLGHPAAESRTMTINAEAAQVLVVPPYLDVIVFDIVSSEPTAERVAIYAPDALRPLDREISGIDEVRVGDTLSTITIHRPAAGQWMFLVPQRSVLVKVFAQQFFPRGILLQPAAAEPPRQHDLVVVAYRAVDGDGASLHELPDYPLALSLSLIAPDRERIPTEFVRRDDLGPATFAAATAVPCDRAGRYSVDVRISTRDISRKDVLIYHDQWSGFVVAAAQRIECRPRAHTTHAAALGIWTPPLEIAIECRDERLRVVDFQSPRDPSQRQWIHSTLYCDGHLLRDDVAFRSRGPLWETAIPMTAKPGAYRLHLSADRSQLPAGANVRFMPADIVFARTASVAQAFGMAVVIATFLAVLICVLACWRRS
jgi:hypothetical protein